MPDISSYFYRLAGSSSNQTNVWAVDLLLPHL
jgi:hypothetical protein